MPEIIRGNWLSDLANCQLSLLLFGNAYALDEIPQHKLLDHILIMYQDSEYMQKAAYKVLKGTLCPQGNLPVSLKHFSPRVGIQSSVS